VRILILGLNFHPELIGIGKYTGEMAAWLAEQGHNLRVITTPPYYPQWQIAEGYSRWRYKRETWGGIQVIRCPFWVPRQPSGLKRLLHLFSFALSALPPTLQNTTWRPEIVLCIAPAFFSAPIG
jgi:colanic acid biosynthesis glycosyl transferase WcaI